MAYEDDPFASGSAAYNAMNYDRLSQFDTERAARFAPKALDLPGKVRNKLLSLKSQALLQANESAQPPARGFVDSFKEAWSRGKFMDAVNVLTDKIRNYDEAEREPALQELDNIVQTYQQAIAEDPINGDGKMVNAVLDAAQSGYPMMQALKRELIIDAALAGATAVLTAIPGEPSEVIPGAALASRLGSAGNRLRQAGIGLGGASRFANMIPKTAGVLKGAKAAGEVGQVAKWAGRGAKAAKSLYVAQPFIDSAQGQIYSDLRHSGVDHDVADNVAKWAGRLHGLIETTILSPLEAMTLGMGDDMIANAARKTLGRYLGNSTARIAIRAAGFVGARGQSWASELGEEYAQGGVEAAARYIGQREQQLRQMVLQDVEDQIADGADKSPAGSALLRAYSAVRDNIGDIVAQAVEQGNEAIPAVTAMVMMGVPFPMVQQISNEMGIRGVEKTARTRGVTDMGTRATAAATKAGPEGDAVELYKNLLRNGMDKLDAIDAFKVKLRKSYQQNSELSDAEVEQKVNDSVAELNPNIFSSDYDGIMQQDQGVTGEARSLGKTLSDFEARKGSVAKEDARLTAEQEKLNVARNSATENLTNDLDEYDATVASLADDDKAGRKAVDAELEKVVRKQVADLEKAGVPTEEIKQMMRPVLDRAEPVYNRVFASRFAAAATAAREGAQGARKGPSFDRQHTITLDDDGTPRTYTIGAKTKRGKLMLIVLDSDGVAVPSATADRVVYNALKNKTLTTEQVDDARRKSWEDYDAVNKAIASGQVLTVVPSKAKRGHFVTLNGVERNVKELMASYNKTREAIRDPRTLSSDTGALTLEEHDVMKGFGEVPEGKSNELGQGSAAPQGEAGAVPGGGTVRQDVQEPRTVPVVQKQQDGVQPQETGAGASGATQSVVEQQRVQQEPVTGTLGKAKVERREDGKIIFSNSKKPIAKAAEDKVKWDQEAPVAQPQPTEATKAPTPPAPPAPPKPPAVAAQELNNAAADFRANRADKAKVEKANSDLNQAVISAKTPPPKQVFDDNGDAYDVQGYDQQRGGFVVKDKFGGMKVVPSIGFVPEVDSVFFAPDAHEKRQKARMGIVAQAEESAQKYQTLVDQTPENPTDEQKKALKEAKAEMDARVKDLKEVVGREEERNTVESRSAADYMEETGEAALRPEMAEALRVQSGMVVDEVSGTVYTGDDISKRLLQLDKEISDAETEVSQKAVAARARSGFAGGERVAPRVSTRMQLEGDKFVESVETKDYNNAVAKLAALRNARRIFTEQLDKLIEKQMHSLRTRGDVRVKAEVLTGGVKLLNRFLDVLRGGKTANAPLDTRKEVKGKRSKETKDRIKQLEQVLQESKRRSADDVYALVRNKMNALRGFVGKETPTLWSTPSRDRVALPVQKVKAGSVNEDGSYRDAMFGSENRTTKELSAREAVKLLRELANMLGVRVEKASKEVVRNSVLSSNEDVERELAGIISALTELENTDMAGLLSDIMYGMEHQRGAKGDPFSKTLATYWADDPAIAGVGENIRQSIRKILRSRTLSASSMAGVFTRVQYAAIDAALKYRALGGDAKKISSRILNAVNKLAPTTKKRGKKVAGSKTFSTPVGGVVSAIKDGKFVLTDGQTVDSLGPEQAWTLVKLAEILGLNVEGTPYTMHDVGEMIDIATVLSQSTSVETASGTQANNGIMNQLLLDTKEADQLGFTSRGMNIRDAGKQIVKEALQREREGGNVGFWEMEALANEKLNLRKGRGAIVVRSLRERLEAFDEYRKGFPKGTSQRKALDEMYEDFRYELSQLREEHQDDLRREMIASRVAGFNVDAAIAEVNSKIIKALRKGAVGLQLIDEIIDSVVSRHADVVVKRLGESAETKKNEENFSRTVRQNVWRNIGAAYSWGTRDRAQWLEEQRVKSESENEEAEAEKLTPEEEATKENRELVQETAEEDEQVDQLDPMDVKSAENSIDAFLAARRARGDAPGARIDKQVLFTITPKSNAFGIVYPTQNLATVLGEAVAADDKTNVDTVLTLLRRYRSGTLFNSPGVSVEVDGKNIKIRLTPISSPIGGDISAIARAKAFIGFLKNNDLLKRAADMNVRVDKTEYAYSRNVLPVEVTNKPKPIPKASPAVTGAEAAQQTGVYARTPSGRMAGTALDVRIGRIADRLMAEDRRAERPILPRLTYENMAAKEAASSPEVREAFSAEENRTATPVVEPSPVAAPSVEDANARLSTRAPGTSRQQQAQATLRNLDDQIRDIREEVLRSNLTMTPEQESKIRELTALREQELRVLDDIALHPRFQSSVGAVGRRFASVREAIRETRNVLRQLGLTATVADKQVYADEEVVATAVNPSNGRTLTIRNSTRQDALGSISITPDGNVEVRINMRDGTITTPRHEMVRHLGIMSLSDGEFRALAEHLGVGTARTLANEESMVRALDKMQANPPGFIKRIWNKVRNSMKAFYRMITGTDIGPDGGRLVSTVETGEAARRGLDSGVVAMDAGTTRNQSTNPNWNRRAERMVEFEGDTAPDAAAESILRGRPMKDTTPEGDNTLQGRSFMRALAHAQHRLRSFYMKAVGSSELLEGLSPTLGAHERALKAEASVEQGRVESMRYQLRDAAIINGHKQDVPVTVGGITHRFTKNQYITAYMLAQHAKENPDGRIAKSLAKAGMRSQVSKTATYMKLKNENDINELLEQAPADVRESAEKLKSIADTLGQELSAVVPDFTQRDWYIPIVRNMLLNSGGASDALERQQKTFLLEEVDAGLLKEVKGSENNPILIADAIDLMNEHINQSAKIVGWMRVHNFYKNVVNSKQVQQAINSVTDTEERAKLYNEVLESERRSLGGIHDPTALGKSLNKAIMRFGGQFLIAPHQIFTQPSDWWSIKTRTDIPKDIRDRYDIYKPISLAERRMAVDLMGKLHSVQTRIRPDVAASSMLGVGDLGSGAWAYSPKSWSVIQSKVTTKMLLAGDSFKLRRIILMAHHTLARDGITPQSDEYLKKMDLLVSDILNDTQAAVTTGNKVQLARDGSIGMKFVNYFYNQQAKAFSKLMKARVRAHTAASVEERKDALKEFYTNLAYFVVLQNAQFVMTKKLIFGPGALTAFGILTAGASNQAGGEPWDEEERRFAGFNNIMVSIAKQIIETAPGAKLVLSPATAIAQRTQGKFQRNDMFRSMHPLMQMGADFVDLMGSAGNYGKTVLDSKFANMSPRELKLAEKKADMALSRVVDALPGVGGAAFGVPLFYLNPVIKGVRRAQNAPRNP